MSNVSHETLINAIKPIQVTYVEPKDNAERIIHFNMTRSENVDRFLRLLIWASKSKVPLTICTIA